MSHSSDAASGATAERPLRRRSPGSPHVFVLAVIEGNDVQQVFRLTRSESLIGRGEACAVRIDDDQISKQHCKVRIEGGVCTVHDLDSTNGTELNGRPFRRGTAQRLRHLDILGVGDTRMVLLSGRYKT